MKWLLIIICGVIIIAGGFLFFTQYSAKTQAITSYDDCVAAGNPIMESYPPRCSANGQTFTQDIGNELEKTELIVVSSPRPNSIMASPILVEGQARGSWFFEASFPVYLYDANGKELAAGIAQAEGEWMTEEFVSFSATLSFDAPTTDTGELILEKSNASGLPEHDDELRIPIRFK